MENWFPYPAASAEKLRHWGLSEVWRVRLAGDPPRTVIAKRGTGSMAAEARCYQDLVIPLGLPAPQVVEVIGADPAILILADAGAPDLEQRSTREDHRAAVRTLARMRCWWSLHTTTRRP